MRLRILVVVPIALMLVGVSLMAQQPPPDFNATGTAFAINATQTAAARPTDETTVDDDSDSFQLTATELVRIATQTAEAFTGNTAVPITNTPIGDESAAQTATALVRVATQTAEPESSETSDSDSNALGLAGLLVAVIVAILGAIGGMLGLNKSDDKAS